MAQHFFKTLTLFVGIVIIGLIGVLVISYFDDNGKVVEKTDAQNQVAK
jgi:hypothetical protein